MIRVAVCYNVRLMYNKFIAFPFEISVPVWTLHGTMDPTVLISDWLIGEVLMWEKVVSYFEISALMFE